MMDEATRAGAHVLWVGMPLMSPDAVLSNVDMSLLNSVYEAEARSHPGVVFMSTTKLLANAAGRYSEYLPDSSGELVQVRTPDGVHIDGPAGDDLLARAALLEIARHWHVTP